MLDEQWCNNLLKSNFAVKHGFLLPKILKQCFKKEKKFAWHIVDPPKVSRIILMATEA